METEFDDGTLRGVMGLRRTVEVVRRRSRFVETGTCSSNRRAMLDSIRVCGSASVSCDEGLSTVWSWRHPRLGLGGSHP
jgi:hypothetical protein